MEEYFSIAEIAIVASLVLALATGIHTLLSAIQGIATIIRDFVISRRKSDVLVKPTPEEIIRYSIKNHHPEDRDPRTLYEKRLDEWKSHLIRMYIRRERKAEGRLITMAGCFFLSFMTVALWYMRGAMGFEPWNR